MGEEITPCRWRGKRKKEKRESAGGRRVCVRPVVPVWCVCPGVAGLVVTAGSRRVGLRCVVFRCNQDMK